MHTDSARIRAFRRAWVAFALVGVLVAGAAVTPSRAQDREAFELGRRACEVHDAIVAKGIPLSTVRVAEGRFELVFPESCGGAQRAEAQRICDELAAAPKVVIEVRTLEDALVVLRFEPENRSANALVRARYDALREQAREAARRRAGAPAPADQGR